MSTPAQLQKLLDLVAVPTIGTTLPEVLPSDPFAMCKQWLDDEVRAAKVPNPNAMSLSTIAPDGRLSTRIVLCRGIDARVGRITFFSNRTSRKGKELASTPRVSLCFHFDPTDRQVRIEGLVTPSPDSESDAYFASRRWESKISAWASNQSQPIASRDALLARLPQVIDELGLSLDALLTNPQSVTIPRPPHWGGYRVYADAIELWLGGTGRLHDRARWERPLPGATAGDPWEKLEHAALGSAGWVGTRLQP
jgi:pyridoxamine 5'-phosphate oxidase